MIQIVGLAHSAVREGRERIRAAARQLKLRLPGMRITVNLAPADIPKSGAALDLPIILGILTAAGGFSARCIEKCLAVGELGLDGALRPVRGALSIAMHAAASPDVDWLLVPFGNLREAGAADGIRVRGARSLTDVLEVFEAAARGRTSPALLRPKELPRSGGTGAAASEGEPPDLSSVRGQSSAKRALEIAAAGGHNILFSGPPGSGKTSLARCLPGLMPPLSRREAVEVTAIHSVVAPPGRVGGLLRNRPFRSPHHSVSEAGLVGGGPGPRPGEASLAHRGVLFLDELPEFSRRALEALRQPLEDKVVKITRVNGTAVFPAAFMLAAAMNPCPCGFGGSDGECSCTPEVLARSERRLSGPLLDRIDMLADVPAVSWRALSATGGGETSAQVRARVIAARREAVGRGVVCNAELDPVQAEKACSLDHQSMALMETAVTRLGLTARGYHRTLRLARTIADLSGSGRVTVGAVAEAIRYRPPGSAERPPALARQAAGM